MSKPLLIEQRASNLGAENMPLPANAVVSNVPVSPVPVYIAGGAVVYEKPRSAVTCDYVWKRTDRWINFPWSTEAPVVSAEDARHKVVDA